MVELKKLILAAILLVGCGDTRNYDAKITCYDGSGKPYFEHNRVYVSVGESGTFWVFKNGEYVAAVSGNCVVTGAD